MTIQRSQLGEEVGEHFDVLDDPFHGSDAEPVFFEQPAQLFTVDEVDGRRAVSRRLSPRISAEVWRISGFSSDGLSGGCSSSLRAQSAGTS